LKHRGQKILVIWLSLASGQCGLLGFFQLFKPSLFFSLEEIKGAYEKLHSRLKESVHEFCAGFTTRCLCWTDHHSASWSAPSIMKIYQDLIWLARVNDDPERVQQHRMMLNEFAEYGVNKITWMTQTHRAFVILLMNK
jgi:hypothetical protein